jgi:hypothetical protein
MPLKDRSLADLDMSSVRFPSDAVTMGRLRQLRPEVFDHGCESGIYLQPLFFMEPELPTHARDTLGDLLYQERYVVAAAYAKAEGIAPPDLDFINLRDLLKQNYIELKLAAGPHEAEELVRSIEAQGTALAQTKTL